MDAFLFTVLGLGFRVMGLGFRVMGLGSRGLGLRAQRVLSPIFQRRPFLL